ncbi:hypothetical protein [Porphyromonas uenonis]
MLPLSGKGGEGRAEAYRKIEEELEVAGTTYSSDRDMVIEHVAKLTDTGEYPSPLL